MSTREASSPDLIGVNMEGILKVFPFLQLNIFQTLQLKVKVLMERFTRRQFLEVGFKAVVAAGGAVYSSTPKRAEAEPNPALANFLASLEPKRSRLEAVVTQNNLYQYLKPGTTIEQQIEDFNMYYPIYKVAQDRFQVPWELLWIVHIQETNVSRERNPEGGGYLGAMQILPSNIRNDLQGFENSYAGLEFLDDLPQRYSQKLGFRTNDWQNIIEAAYFIRGGADKTGLPDDQDLENVIIYRYSAPIFGRQRWAEYQRWKAIFAIVDSKPDVPNPPAPTTPTPNTTPSNLLTSLPGWGALIF
ncbi:hypothetical protein HY389_02045 [Candidatus Daviesbacteria bacterium]|nr:hypothetical protein [Candidatus Daviesbacteria bacterium]